MQSNWNFHALLQKYKMVKASLKNSLVLCYKIKYTLYTPEIPLRFYPKDVKTDVHEKTSTWMFIAFLFIITPELEIIQMASTNECLNSGTSIW